MTITDDSKNTASENTGLAAVSALIQKMSKTTGLGMVSMPYSALTSRYSAVAFFHQSHPEIIAYCRQLAAEEDVDLLDWLLRINFDTLGSEFDCTYEVLTDVYADNNQENEFYDDMVRLLIEHLLDDAYEAAPTDTQVASNAVNTGGEPTQSDTVLVKCDEVLSVAMKREILTNSFCFTVDDNGVVFDENGNQTDEYNTLQAIIYQAYESGARQAKSEIRKALGIQ